MFGIKHLVFCAFFMLLAALSVSAEPAGVWHTKVGELDFWMLQDDAGEMNNALFGDDAAIAKLAPAGKSPSSFNVFLVKKGESVVLIDTGKGGQLLQKLKAVGVEPKDVTAVVLTHTHGDHVGGLFSGENRTFPNASLWLSEKELKFWEKSNPALCEKSKKYYGEFKLITPDEKTAVVLPEITALDIAGHTPGHTAFLLVSQNEKLLVVADLLHSGNIQFARPDINARFDADPTAAANIREKTMTMAAIKGILFAASHLPFPGIGRVQTDGTDGNKFRFVPVSDEQTAKSLYDFTVKDIDGNDFPLKNLKGKKVMVVNVASKCGLTPQYKELQKLFTQYGEKNFAVIAFPANNFGQQEPGTDSEIKEFCTTKYSVTFPVMSKISVKGDDIHPLYRWLTEQKLNGKKDAPVQWNFQKFLINEYGQWVDVVPPKEKPDSEAVLNWLRSL